jgi:hypothetical protein
MIDWMVLMRFVNNKSLSLEFSPPEKGGKRLHK